VLPVVRPIVRYGGARSVRAPKHHRPNHRMMISDGLSSTAVDQESRP
jgi:hypothetical protein